MEPLTLELFRCLQSEPYDESGLSQIRGLLLRQRGLSRAKQNLSTLADLIPLLEGWASAAGPGRLASEALLEAADIAANELGKHDLATRLRTSAAAQSGGDRNVNSAAAYVALARRRADAGDVDGAIDAYEHALSLEAELATVRQLADLFARRAAPGDAAQAADLYFTLADVLGNPAGIAMLERALALQPEYQAARDLLARFRGKPVAAPTEAPATKPKGQRLLVERPNTPIAITELPRPPSALGRPPRRGARRGPPPLAAAVARSNAPFSAAPSSSLSPVVRQELTFEDEPAPARKRWLVISGAFGGLGAVAAAAAFFLLPSRSGHSDAPPLMAAVVAKPAALPVPAVVDPPKPVAEVVAANSGAGSAAPAPASVPAVSAAPAAVEAPVEPVASATASEKPSELKPTVEIDFDVASVHGGKLSSAQLSSAFEKTTPKLERCYVQTLKKKPKTKGRLTFSWTVKPNGRVASLKKLSDTVNDPVLAQCSQQAIAATRFPKPKKQAALVKLPVDYRRS